MSKWPDDIYTEPEPDVHTLNNLGPLTPLAGIWEGDEKVSEDIHPKSYGKKRQAYIERLEMQPIDPQTNGPQLLYGLRYWTHIVKPGEVETFHDQVGYWLWEKETGIIMHSLTIPRGQAVLAGGTTTADATQFTLTAKRGDTQYGIISNPFLERAFKTDAFEINVSVHDNGSWSYQQTTTMTVEGKDAPFLHTDQNDMHKVAEPTPNPLALEAIEKQGE